MRDSYEKRITDLTLTNKELEEELKVQKDKELDLDNKYKVERSANEFKTKEIERLTAELKRKEKQLEDRVSNIQSKLTVINV